MKHQGTADRKVAESRKVEPNSKAINPGGAFGIGTKEYYTKTPLVAGRGYFGPTPSPQAPGPGGGRTVRSSGSQGRH